MQKGAFITNTLKCTHTHRCMHRHMSARTSVHARTDALLQCARTAERVLVAPGNALSLPPTTDKSLARLKCFLWSFLVAASIIVPSTWLPRSLSAHHQWYLGTRVPGYLCLLTVIEVLSGMSVKCLLHCSDFLKSTRKMSVTSMLRAIKDIG